jgi:hypothetical protein
MAKTLLLGKRAYRVLTRRRNSITLQPLDTEYPHVLLMRDPDPGTRARYGERWGVSDWDARRVTWYRKLDDGVFEKIG